MSTVTATALRTLTFGDLEAGIWGVGWADADAVLTAGTTTNAAAIPNVSLSGSEADEAWHLYADDAQLTISSEGEAADESEFGGFDQLCRVRGTLTLAGGERAIDCLGRRAARGRLDVERLDSVRDFSAWFHSGESADAEPQGLALTALRPREAEGNEADLIGAVLFESGAPIRVADPRFSTTYGEQGDPVRVGLELWLSDDEEGEHPYPRRAAGEALSATASAELGSLSLQARPFRCHSRGLEGLGVYVLARPR